MSKNATLVDHTWASLDPAWSATGSVGATHIALVDHLPANGKDVRNSFCLRLVSIILIFMCTFVVRFFEELSCLGEETQSKAPGSQEKDI